MQQMHLSQIWGDRIFPGRIAMLYCLTLVRISFDAKACDKTDHSLVPFAKAMACTTADRDHDGWHVWFR